MPTKLFCNSIPATDVDLDSPFGEVTALNPGDARPFFFRQVHAGRRALQLAEIPIDGPQFSRGQPFREIDSLRGGLQAGRGCEEHNERTGRADDAVRPRALFVACMSASFVRRRTVRNDGQA